jgi:hypothetical protein
MDVLAESDVKRRPGDPVRFIAALNLDRIIAFKKSRGCHAVLAPPDQSASDDFGDAHFLEGNDAAQ